MCNFIRAFYSAPRGEGDADFKIRGPATQKNYGNATAAPPEPGRNFGPALTNMIVVAREKSS